MAHNPYQHPYFRNYRQDQFRGPEREEIEAWRAAYAYHDNSGIRAERY